MTINDILPEECRILGNSRLTLERIVVRPDVVYGDLCRYARTATTDQPTHTNEELQRELGNIITSTVRWCDDIGFDPNDCIRRALAAQQTFASRNPER